MFGLELHEDWRRIARHAWSVRFMALSALLGGVGAGLPIAQPYLNVNPLIVASIVGAATCGSTLLALAARFVAQPQFKSPSTEPESHGAANQT